MTYCRAWKKKGYIFMVTDSCISKREENATDFLSSFGEKGKLSDKYTVNESEIKIVKVNEEIAICYSGNVDTAKVAIQTFVKNIRYLSVYESLEVLKNSYKNNEFQLIVICKEETEGKIYCYRDNSIEEVDDYIEIGSGKSNSSFTTKVNKHLKDDFYELKIDDNICLLNKSEEFDANKYLVNSMAYIQYVSIDENMFDIGVGGLFGGIYLGDTINWCKDILYYQFEGKLKNYKTISVISRYNTYFTYSDFNKAITMYFNKIKDDDEWCNNIYNKERIIKCLIEGFPDYVVIYNKSTKVICVINVNKYPFNNYFKMWIKRNDNETKYAFLLSNIFIELKNILEPSLDLNNSLELFNIKCTNEKFERREDCVGYACSNCESVEDWDEEYDFELRILEREDKYLSTKIDVISNSVEKYHNIVIIEYQYFYKCIYEECEKHEFLKNRLKEIRLELFVRSIARITTTEEFSQFAFYFIKGNGDNTSIDDFSLIEWINNYSNCYIINVDNNVYNKELSSIILQCIQNYYYNEKYYHIDKIMILSECNEINGILDYLPRKNFQTINPDVVLIRNINELTNMDGRLNYFVIDIVIYMLFGCNNDEIQLLLAGIL